ncbi:MAG TPA: DUF1667 domain-containing protein [Spirochaetota bacterium]|nr:DUF1667 domain-containing protein [Spirochaetota bacterium]HOS32577.1 DUF1667 domain-containing protein [Spirochaetota bacterium]HOS54647.1 DUF1667 domain-containing protein [Spirochaetota bacterium]HPK62036.1 DUF1667 domain-containing protein [Spirochaetota bacterium]HQF77333.1 DUF1667 domain-containing protein [Spirochaetota bacterium]
MKNIICLSCPIGCNLKAEFKNEELIISGNKCPKGTVFAKNELASPKRIVTSTCRINSTITNRIPLKTDAPVSKKDIEKILRLISDITLNSPVKSGEVVINDILNSGVDIIATRTIEK